MQVVVRLPRVTYCLDIDSKFTLISDLSVTGKTTMLNDITAAKLTNDIVSTIPIVVALTARGYSIRERCRSIIFIDGTSDILYNQRDVIIKDWLHSDNLFVIASREVYSFVIPEDYMSVKMLQRQHSVIKLVPR